MQLRIRRKINKSNANTYFTVSMLQTIKKVVGSSIKGIDPDSDETPAQWIKKYLKKAKESHDKYLKNKERLEKLRK